MDQAEKAAGAVCTFEPPPQVHITGPAHRQTPCIASKPGCLRRCPAIGEGTGGVREAQHLKFDTVGIDAKMLSPPADVHRPSLTRDEGMALGTDQRILATIKGLGIKGLGIDLVVG